MGGCDSVDNLIKLSIEDHIIAHYILYKIHPNNEGLRYAVEMMCVYNKITSNEMYKDAMYKKLWCIDIDELQRLLFLYPIKECTIRLNTTLGIVYDRIKRFYLITPTKCCKNTLY